MGGVIIPAGSGAGAAGPLVTLPNGARVPADTPAVAAAKAAFRKAGGVIIPAGGGAGAAGGAYAGPQAGAGPLVTLANGAVVPADTPAVAAAKAAFRKAGGNIIPAGDGASAALGSLVTFPNGARVPADTPAVAAAKAAFRKAGGIIIPALGDAVGGGSAPAAAFAPFAAAPVYTGPLAGAAPLVT